jgi:hypothetical protein
MNTEIILAAAAYEAHDDCLTAAAEDVAAEHGLEVWEVDAEWADDERQQIIATIPKGAA